MQQRQRIVLLLKLYLSTFSEEKKKKVILIAISFYPGLSYGNSKDSFSSYDYAFPCLTCSEFLNTLKTRFQEKKISILNAVIE